METLTHKLQKPDGSWTLVADMNIETKLEVGLAAKAEMQRTLPMLRGFVQALVGKPMGLEMGAMSATDGHKIMLRVPFELGLPDEHPEANGKDELVTVLCHEISHILYGSFDDLDSGNARGKARLEAVHAETKRLGWEQATERIDKVIAAYGTGTSYMAVAGSVHPLLPSLVNAIEDSRVNRQIGEVRPGVQWMLNEKTTRLVKEGCRNGNGDQVLYKEMDLVYQVSIGVLGSASGVDEILTCLSQEAVDIVLDDVIQEVILQAIGADTVGDTYAAAVALLKRLIELGVIDEDDALAEPDLRMKVEQLLTDIVLETGSDRDVVIENMKVINPADTSSTESYGMRLLNFALGDLRRDDRKGAGFDAQSACGCWIGVDNVGSTSNTFDVRMNKLIEEWYKSDEGGDEGEPGGTEAGSGAGGGGGSSLDSSPEEEGESGGDSDGDPQESGDEGSEAGGDSEDTPDWEEVAKEIQRVMGHDEEEIDRNGDTKETSSDAGQDTMKALAARERLGDVPKGGKTQVSGVVELHVEDESWRQSNIFRSTRVKLPPASPHVTNRTVSSVRKHLQANDRSKYETNLKHGPKLNGRALARIPLGGRDIYAKRTLPKKRDYHFVVMLDCSGSTSGPVMDRIRETGMVLGDIFKRLDMSFEMYGHTADYLESHDDDLAKAASATFGSSYGGLVLLLAHIKHANEIWNDTSRDRLRRMSTAGANLDGHAMRFARLQAQQSRAARKVVVYLSDGQMPAENFTEEKQVLEAECALMKRSRDITAIGLGIDCESPAEYGLETLRMDNLSDLEKLGPFIGKFIK